MREKMDISELLVDWVFQTREVREKVNFLKSIGDFRSAGLIRIRREGARSFIISASSSVFVCSLVFLINGDETENAMIVLFTVVFCVIVTISSRIVLSREILLCSFGELADGKLRSAEFWNPPFPPFGWQIYYEFETLSKYRSGKKKFLGKLRKLSRNYAGVWRPEAKNEPVLIFYESKDPSKNTIYIPEYFSTCCISATRKTQIEQVAKSGG